MKPKFYYTKDKEGNPRHVVVATSEVQQNGKVSVERVGLHPTVAGSSRKGRPPVFHELSLSELVEMDLKDVPDELYKAAEAKLAPAAESEDGGDQPENSGAETSLLN